MGLYVSGTVASWSHKHIGDRVTPSTLRQALRDHPELIEFHLVSTPVSRGGYATVMDAGKAGVDQITVRSDDLRDILAVITIENDRGDRWIVS